MRQDKKQKDRPAIALVLCFCMMALVSLFIVKANIDKVRNNMEGDNVADVVKEKPVNESEKNKNDIVDSADNEKSNSKNNTEDSAPAEFIVPLNGEIIMEYSMDMPIYWETLDQYMTHGGVDIAAPSGTSVKACAGGTVTRVEEDDKFGIVAEINHGNDVISLYGNLAKDGLVEVGDVVKQGDTLGKIGQSSLFEFESPDHLHFEMQVKGEPADPSNYIKF